MEDWKGSSKWTKKELATISRQKERMRELEEKAVCADILGRQTNSLQFYRITPKEELPKFLQKMKFQTLHLKEKDITSSIRIFKKENRKPQQQQLRKKLRAEGHLMLLSEIYQHLGETAQIQRRPTAYAQPKMPELSSELDEWEKARADTASSTIKQPKGTHKEKSSLQQGSDYKTDIEKSLGIIQVTHASEFNLMSRYVLVENSSKLLKRELDQKRSQVQESIKSKMKQLYEARTDYHNLFQQKNRLKIQERLLAEQTKDDALRFSHKSLTAIRNEKTCELRLQKRGLLDANDNRIQKVKSTIASLQSNIAQEEQELRKIMMAQKLYYKISLKNGNDVRQTGLVWIVKKLQIKEEDIDGYEFPVFLDKKCKAFLVHKAASEQQEQQLLEEKRKFVNEIGRTSSQGKLKYKSIISPKQLLADRVMQSDLGSESVPKKYRRSLKKITQLNEEFIKNSSLLQIRQRERSKLIEISSDLQGLSNKQIYSQIGERIKRLDLSKMKKDKLGSKKMKLLQYQSLLEKIKNIHIKLQEMDLQMESHLLGHYRDNRNLYFMQAAACFGYKRAYSMIIKHFSWKNYQDPSPSTHH